MTHAPKAPRGAATPSAKRIGRASGGILGLGLLVAALVLPVSAVSAESRMSPASMDSAAVQGSAVAEVDPVESEPTADIAGLSDRLDTLSDLPEGVDPGSDPVAAELGLAGEGLGSLQVEEGRVAVSILYAERPDEADFAALAALANVQATSTELARASAYVAPANLDAVAALPKVASVTEALKPGTSADAGSLVAAASPVAAAGPSAAPLCRSIEAVGLSPLRADLASAIYGVDGTGITVGILSDSFATSPAALSTPAQDVAAGLLPGPGNPCGYEHPVNVLTDDSSDDNVDEGRGMAQVVHSIAPGATLAFATVGIDELTFHDAILALKAAGATVIVDDIYMFTEPYFQQGPVGVAIDTVQREGVTYLSSAGNYNNIGREGYPSAGYALNGWQTDAYRPTACPAGVLTAMGPGTFDCMDFAQSGTPDATATLTLRATSGPAIYALQWAEPSGFAKGTFVLTVTDDAGNTRVLDRDNGNLPVTAGNFQPPTDGAYHFSIVRDLTEGAQAAITPAINWVWSFHNDIRAAEYFGPLERDRVGAAIAGHTGLPSVVSVAALPADDPTIAESFSSPGPVTLYFDYDPAVSPVPQPLPAPLTVAKPDVAGVDRILTNFFSSTRPVAGRPGVYAFWGTSAAAPTVAAVVALGREYSPASTPSELRAALGSTTVAAFSPAPYSPATDVVGSGRVDAAAFLAALPEPEPAPADTDVAGASTGQSTQLAATGRAAGTPVVSLVLALTALGVAATGVALVRRRPHERAATTARHRDCG